MTTTTEISRAARLAGLLYIALAPLGPMALLYVPEFIIVTGDHFATLDNLRNSTQWVGVSIFSALLLQLIQLAAAYFLFKMLSPVNRFLAALIIVFTALAMPIAMLMEVFKSVAVTLSTQTDLTAMLGEETVAAGVHLLLSAYMDAMMVAHTFWGLWLLPMGYLVARSGYLPAWIGVLLIIAGFGYLADTVLWALLGDAPFTIAEYTFAGEVILPLWLIFKGVNAPAFTAKYAAA